MKIVALCLLMSLSSFSWVFGQYSYSGKAQYKVTYNYSVDRSELKDDNKNIPSNIQNDIREAHRLVDKMTGKLIFNNVASIYHSPRSINSDNMVDIIASGAVRSDHTYYHNRTKKVFIIENRAFGGARRSLDDREMIWNILPEKAIINGIECQKAEGIFKTPGFTDTVVEVWFAPDIPFPYGPTNAYGLPGLILKYKWGFLEIEVNKIKRITDGSVELIIPDFGDIPLLSGSVREN